MHTSNRATPKKKPTSNQTIAIVATEFHIERRKSYYKVRFRDIDGQKQTMAIGRELFTTSSKVVAELLKANADLPDNPKAAVGLVEQAVATRSKRTRRITIRTGRMIRRLSTRDRRSALLRESSSWKTRVPSIPLWVCNADRCRLGGKD